MGCELSNLRESATLLSKTFNFDRQPSRWQRHEPLYECHVTHWTHKPTELGARRKVSQAWKRAESRKSELRIWWNCGRNVKLFLGFVLRARWRSDLSKISIWIREAARWKTNSFLLTLQRAKLMLQTLYKVLIGRKESHVINRGWTGHCTKGRKKSFKHKRK